MRVLSVCTVRVFVVVVVAAMGFLSGTMASAQPVSVVSVATDGTAGNGPSGPAAAISGDGRFVAFASAATNLVAGDTNASVDVFLKDRVSGTVTRLSVASDGLERSGDSGVGGVAISADGTVVAFTSRAALLPGDTNLCPPGADGGTGPSCTDIYVWRGGPGTLMRGNMSAQGQQADGPSREPALHKDGLDLYFTSDATNLTAGDTNGAADIFWRRLEFPAIKRISVTSAGVQGNGPSRHPVAGRNLEDVAFLSVATNFSDAADPTCPAGQPCTRAFLHDSFGQTAQIPISLPDQAQFQVDDVALSAGEFGSAYAAVSVNRPSDGGSRILVRVGSDPIGKPPLECGSNAGVELDGNGRLVVCGPGTVQAAAVPGGVMDHLTTFRRNLFPPPAGSAAPGLTLLGVSYNGRFVLYSVIQDVAAAGDSNGFRDVLVVDLDADADGMNDEWETRFGLNPQSAADAALDSDGDGLTNLQEYERNGHPIGTFKRYFAEGAQNAFFNTRLALLNPGAAPAQVLLRTVGSNRVSGVRVVELAATQSWFDSLSSFVPPNNDFSIEIESNQPVVADRSMHWGTGSAAGSHGETALEAPATTWYFAEGATHGAFDLFFLLENPNPIESVATVTIEYLRPPPAPPIVQSYDVYGRIRRTIWVDRDVPGLEATDVSATITSNLPILAERSMYLSRPGVPFAGGLNGAGVTTPSTHWFLAEGATGSFFDLYVLIANPGTVDAALDVTYLRPDGEPITKQYSVPARSRRTISVEGEDPRLADTPVATLVTSTNGQPVIVERSMWWPFSDWQEGHLSAGATATGTRWAFADGATLTDPATDTYALIANTSNRAGSATVTLVPENGAPQQQEIALPANSRVNVNVTDAFPLVRNQRFGMIVESDGVELVVEHAQYQSVGGAVWSAGHAQLAVKMP
jgi:hypothetical protein